MLRAADRTGDDSIAVTSMRVAYVTIDHPLDIRSWSGSNRNIALALERQAIEVDYVGPLHDPYRVAKRIRGRLVRLSGRSKYLPDRSHASARSYARQVARRLRTTRPDLVFSTGTIPIAFLDVEFPIAFWADSNFAAMHNYYPDRTGVGRRSVVAGNELERRGLARASLAIYASDWAAESAATVYDVDPAKIAVVPFGPNIEGLSSRSEAHAAASGRTRHECRLLFFGVDWERKGGAIAVEAAQALNEAGVPTTLFVVGCEPPLSEVPPFVISRGFLSKSTEAGRAEIRRLLKESHFLIHPARAEAYGVVFAEASAFALPSIASKTGGIPTAVHNGRNGYLLQSDADGAAYAALIGNLFTHQENYLRLALSSYDEFEQRLNWATAGATVAHRLSQLTVNALGDPFDRASVNRHGARLREPGP